MHQCHMGHKSMTAYVQSAAHTNGTIVPPVSLHPTVKSDVGGCAGDGRQPDEAIKTASQGHVNLLIFQLPGLTNKTAWIHRETRHSAGFQGVHHLSECQSYAD